MKQKGEVLISGKTSFKIEVPYKLIETGTKGEKPLIVYLHGYKQNLQYFEKKVERLLEVEAYHLFIQGPYPIYDEERRREVDRWGRAWYLYDGRQDQFIKSMEISAEFIQDLIDQLIPQISVSKIAIVGYSMGGYLAGYFALSRPKYITDLLVIGGRIKTEHFMDQSYAGLNVLALHGSDDESVAAQRENESCRDLEKLGAAVTFRQIHATHRLSSAYIDKIWEWFQDQEYKIIN